jgi:hypothetical protein
MFQSLGEEGEGEEVWGKEEGAIGNRRGSEEVRGRGRIRGGFGARERGREVREAYDMRVHLSVWEEKKRGEEIMVRVRLDWAVPVGPDWAGLACSVHLSFPLFFLLSFYSFLFSYFFCIFCINNPNKVKPIPKIF